MTQKLYRYSILWRIFYTATVPLIYFLIIAYTNNTGPAFRMYLNIGITVVALVPYFFLLMKFSEVYIVSDTHITQKNVFVQRTLGWKNILEYRDFYNMIVLMPLVVKRSINIFFYRNVAGYETLRRYLLNRSNAFEVNMMSRKRDRLFLIIDIGAVPVLIIICTIVAAVGVFHYFHPFDLSPLMTGLGAGTLFVLCSVAAWMLFNDLSPMAKEYTHIIGGLLAITLMAPMMLLCLPGDLGDSPFEIGVFLTAYVLGYVVGWGGMSAFFPNREHRQHGSRRRHPNA